MPLGEGSSLTIESEDVLRIDWKWEKAETCDGELKISFGWKKLTKSVRIRKSKKGEEFKEVQYKCGYIENDWKKLEEYDEDNWMGRSEHPYSVELETFLVEMDKRLRELAERITMMVGPKHIDEKKLREVGMEFLKMLPEGGEK